MQYQVDDTLYLQLDHLTMSELQKIRLVSRRFNQIYNDNNFWRWKFYRDRGFIPENTDDYRNLYRNYCAVYKFKYNGNPTDIRIIKTDLYAKKIVTCTDSVLYLDFNQQLWGWGENQACQLGRVGPVDPIDNPVLIASSVADVCAGAWHVVFLDTKGVVWGMGSNAVGQLSSDNTVSIITPTIIYQKTVITTISCGYRDTFMIDVQGHVISPNRSDDDPSMCIINQYKVTKIASFNRKICFTQGTDLMVLRDNTIVKKYHGVLDFVCGTLYMMIRYKDRVQSVDIFMDDLYYPYDAHRIFTSGDYDYCIYDDRNKTSHIISDSKKILTIPGYAVESFSCLNDEFYFVGTRIIY